MSGWDRYGEEKKYRKDCDMNDNPKHVGEPLRKLTLEDRKELRQQAREQAKKRSITEELDDDEDDSDGLDCASAKRAKSGDFDSAEASPDRELDFLGKISTNGNGSSNSKDVVDLADEAAVKRAAVRRARRRAKAAAAKAKVNPAGSIAPSPSTSLDIDTDAAGAAARRKADCPAAAASPSLDLDAVDAAVPILEEAPPSAKSARSAANRPLASSPSVDLDVEVVVE